MDWLKSKYRELLVNGLISAMCVMLGFWAYGFRQSNSDDEARMKKLETEKASYGYVDGKYRDHFAYDLIQDKQIEKKADKSLVESMDKKLDLILIKLD